MVVAAATPALAAPPAKLPGNADALETTWQPAYDYDTDGCYPTPWCAVTYGLYFEKDQALANSSIGGHRHEWEHVVVWVENDQARYVSTSAHGEFEVYAASSVRWDGNHPKIVYHKDGASTHTFRLAGAGDEPPENAYHTWQFPTLVGWNGFPAGIRDTLSAYDFGSANFGLRDANFVTTLTRAEPAGLPFDPAA
jgi:hypothetical protein